MFIENKYKNWYMSLMKCGSTEKPERYSERHHIIPKSLGGSDAASNLVYLTARQHYIAHLLLVRMTEGAAKRSMTFAMIRFAGKNRDKGYKIVSRLYERIRNDYSEANKGEGNPMYGKPCYYNMSPEKKAAWIANIAAGVAGDKNPFYGKKHNSRTRSMISGARSQAILVKFADGSNYEFSQYKLLGTHLGKSGHLGAKLLKEQYRHLWAKYNIEDIVKI